MRLAGLAMWFLPVGVCSPVCLRTGVGSGRGALRTSPFPSVCRAGIVEAGGQGRPDLGEHEALGRGSRHAWELSTGEMGGEGEVGTGELTGAVDCCECQPWVLRA